MENDSSRDKYSIVEIRDLGLAAALVSLGHNLQGTNRNNSGRVYFVFKDTPALQTATDAYWNNELNVNARAYSDALKTLKNLIYSERY